MDQPPEGPKPGYCPECGQYPQAPTPSASGSLIDKAWKTFYDLNPERMNMGALEIAFRCGYQAAMGDASTRKHEEKKDLDL